MIKTGIAQLYHNKNHLELYSVYTKSIQYWRVDYCPAPHKDVSTISVCCSTYYFKTRTSRRQSYLFTSTTAFFSCVLIFFLLAIKNRIKKYNRNFIKCKLKKKTAVHSWFHVVAPASKKTNLQWFNQKQHRIYKLLLFLKAFSNICSYFTLASLESWWVFVCCFGRLLLLC